MAHLSRRELKTDEFMSGLDAAWEYCLEHRRLLITAGVIVVVVALAVWGGLSWRQHRLHQAQSELAQGLELYHATISTQPLPNGQPSFPTATARAQAALAKFRAAAAYRGTRPGRLARYYSALAEIDAGHGARGAAGLKRLSGSSHANLAALARAALANYELSQGNDAEAATQFRQLLAHPAPAVPRATILWQLAGIESHRDPSAAQQLYRQIVQQYPNSQTAQAAAQRLGQNP